ncbi:MAG TPA: MarR family transcriptional regulator [Candidatus Blautia pullistercoris]|uniref:HTH-type transcriptional regulator SarZ n=1 Tax=Candidatus Blautia pullistercoris TaxID=2838499 RepID=A0A9D2ANC0_9FIRM|nr:MarR family transcriptional regulator [Clostridiales bacterium]HIX37775.1 MarR family transcriptional regulator [Candidatus Blautia pullistercoris]
MSNYEVLHDILVRLFQEILDIESKALITSEFKDISVNDMHIIEAIGEKEPKNMSTVAKIMSVTVGTLTIAINSLVKKGYVHRERSEEDRRVVLISLTEKGRKANAHHQKFHDGMIQAVLKDLDEDQQKILVKSLMNLRGFFDSYR